MRYPCFSRGKVLPRMCNKSYAEKTLTLLIRKTSLENCIWSAKLNTVRAIFCRKRKQIAQKLGNPKLNRITLHTFRHSKYTCLYAPGEL